MVTTTAQYFRTLRLQLTSSQRGSTLGSSAERDKKLVLVGPRVSFENLGRYNS